VGHPRADHVSVLPELTEAAAEAREDQERRSRPLGEGEKLDPNREEEAELDRLPGVGPAVARAIIAARDSGATFAKPEDLLVVRGIGPKMLARIRPHIELRPPPRALSRPSGGVQPRVDINRAGLEELQELPGVGPVIAERILARRLQRRFGSVDDLIEVRGIGPTTLEQLRSRASAGGSS
jgi:competence ComEA-like helix-hairpin-helix protein